MFGQSKKFYLFCIEFYARKASALLKWRIIVIDKFEKRDYK